MGENTCPFLLIFLFCFSQRDPSRLSLPSSTPTPTSHLPFSSPSCAALFRECVVCRKSSTQAEANQTVRRGSSGCQAKANLPGRQVNECLERFQARTLKSGLNIFWPPVATSPQLQVSPTTPPVSQPPSPARASYSSKRSSPPPASFFCSTANQQIEVARQVAIFNTCLLPNSEQRVGQGRVGVDTDCFPLVMFKNTLCACTVCVCARSRFYIVMQII